MPDGADETVGITEQALRDGLMTIITRLEATALPGRDLQKRLI
jgi:hypothetical protein